MTGSLHVGLAALGAAIGVGFIGTGRVDRRRAQSRRVDEDHGAVDPGHRLRRSDRVLRAVPACARSASTRVRDAYHADSAFQSAAESGGQLEEIARTFGVDWPHLLAQIVSFGIVCTVLYWLAYTPILTILEARRQQIADGLANAEKIKAELARIEVERQDMLAKAGDDGKQLIEEARAAAARVQAEETQKAVAAAEQMLVRAREATERDRAQMLAELRREVGRLVVQTDRDGDRKDSDA